MKKIHILIIVYALIGVILFTIISFVSPSDINGRYKTLGLARQAVSYYDGADIVHTVDFPDCYVDFIIDKDGILFVVTIEKSNMIFGQHYRKSEMIGFYTDIKIKECTDYFNQNEKIQWHRSNQYSNSDFTTVYWTVLEQNCVVEDRNIESYEFTLKENGYMLYTKYDLEN